MPYRTEYIEPEVFIIHRGVTVYHVYKNDDVENGPREYWFTLSIIGAEDDEETFDVRELPTWTSAEDREKAIRDAIDAGHFNGQVFVDAEGQEHTIELVA